MKKFKNGFIISTTLYSIFGILIITCVTILFILSNNRTIVQASVDDVKACINCGYVCNQNTSGDKEPSVRDYILSLNDVQTKKIDITKYAVSTTYYNKTSNKSNLVTGEDGLFVESNSDGTNYFFRGAINNNYFNFAGLEWRILRINGDGSLRIILNDVVEPKIYYFDNTYKNKTDVLKSTDTLTTYSCTCSSSIKNGCSNDTFAVEKCDGEDYTYINLNITRLTANGTYPIKYKMTYSNRFNKIDIGKQQDNMYNMYDSNNIYLKILNKWFDEKITGTNRNYIQSTNSFCNYGTMLERDYKYKTIIPDSLKCSVSEEATLIYYRFQNFSNTAIEGYNNTYLKSLNAGFATRNELAYAGYGVHKLIDYGADSMSSLNIYNGYDSNGSANGNDNFLNADSTTRGKSFVLGNRAGSDSTTLYKDILNVVNADSSIGGASFTRYSDNSSKVEVTERAGNSSRVYSLYYYGTDTTAGSEIIKLNSNTARYGFFTYYTADLAWVNNIRPVINIKPNVQLTGTGTKENPYSIVN